MFSSKGNKLIKTPVTEFEPIPDCAAFQDKLQASQLSAAWLLYRLLLLKSHMCMSPTAGKVCVCSTSRVTDGYSEP